MSDRIAFAAVLTGTPRDTMSARTVKGSVRERRSPLCFFNFPSSTAGTPACIADAAALISSGLATVPMAFCALAISKASERTAITMRGPSAPMARPWYIFSIKGSIGMPWARAESTRARIAARVGVSSLGRVRGSCARADTAVPASATIIIRLRVLRLLTWCCPPRPAHYLACRNRHPTTAARLDRRSTAFRSRRKRIDARQRAPTL